MDTLDSCKFVHIDIRTDLGSLLLPLFEDILNVYALMKRWDAVRGEVVI